MKTPPLVRTWAPRVAAVIAVLVTILTVRVLVDGGTELTRAEAYRNAGEFESALTHYRRAARLYVPASPHVEEALAAIEQMAEEEERAGSVERALFAWRQIRAAILPSVSFYVPHAERLARADRRIADLTAELPPPPIDAGRSREEVRLAHLELLSRAEGPSAFFAFVAVFGWLTWVGSAFAFFRHGIDEEDRLRKPIARRWAGAIGLGFALFTLGLALA